MLPKMMFGPSKMWHVKNTFSGDILQDLPIFIHIKKTLGTQRFHCNGQVRFFNEKSVVDSLVDPWIHIHNFPFLLTHKDKDSGTKFL